MVDLREHKDLIRKLVTAENEKDEDWKWSVKSIGKFKVLVGWSYLDYCGAKSPENCFSITVDYPDDDVLGDSIAWRHPDGHLLNAGSVGPNHWDVGKTVEEVLEAAIGGIAYYAHSRY